MKRDAPVNHHQYATNRNQPFWRSIMAEQSLTYLISLINQQADEQENLSEYLAKADALAQVAVTTEFLELSEFVVHNYLWVLSDIISQARELNERLLNSWLKQMPQIIDELQ